MRYLHCDHPMRNIWQATDYRCRCGLVIEVYGDLIIDGYTGQAIEIDSEQGDEMTIVIPADVTPYYLGPDVVIGFDTRGRDVEVRNGEATPLFSISQKIAAYQEALEVGFPEVAGKLGIDVSTLRRWKTVKPV